MSSVSIIDGTIEFGDIGQNGAAAGQVMKWNGSAWAAAEDETGSGATEGWIDAGTVVHLETHSDSVGIGTSTPSAKLHVDGGARIIGKATIGLNQDASGLEAAISGGQDNIATGDYSMVSGGMSNQATGEFNTIGGGQHNETELIGAAIAGGIYNEAKADYATVGGGYVNSAKGSWSTVCGGNMNRAHGSLAFIGGGKSNTATGGYSSIGGGTDNAASGTASTVGGGTYNIASDYWSNVCGGSHNRASKNFAAVGGGNNNEAGGSRSVVSGGDHNQATDAYSSICGGRDNIASGYCATVVGGEYNAARGYNSLAAGFNARANAQGSVVIAANNSVDISTLADSVISNSAGQLVLHASTQFYLTNQYEEAPLAGEFLETSTGAYLSNGGTWTNASDENLKENFASIDKHELLEKVSELPITRWNYKEDEPGIQHIGPVAQDFHVLFGVGNDDRSISTVDPAGVALAAIQALHEKTKELEKKSEEIETLKKQVADLSSLVETLLAGRNNGDTGRAARAR